MTPISDAGNGHARFEDLRGEVIQHDKRLSALEVSRAEDRVILKAVARRVARIDRRTSESAEAKRAAAGRANALTVIQIVVAVLMAIQLIRPYLPAVLPAAAGPPAVTAPAH